MEFVGENGSDTGGLTREFFTVLVSPKYIDSRGCFKHNSIALQVRNKVMMILVRCLLSCSNIGEAFLSIGIASINVFSPWWRWISCIIPICV